MLIAVDTGGTKTLVASFSDKGVLGKSVKFPTPKDEPEYVKELIAAITSLGQVDDIDAIIIALPGRVKDNVLESARNLGWKDLDLKKELAQFYNGPILVENDANLGGLAEARALKHTPRVALYVTISTGIGTGVITNGHIDPGFTQSEGGQVVVEHRGKLERWENFSSGSAIVREYKKFARDITSKRTWRRIAENISKGFLVITPVLRPDIIIVGGSIGTYFDRFEEYLLQDLHKQLHYVPEIIAAKHPEEAVIYGCYYYAIDSLTTT